MLFSVVVPIYNVETFLPETINSVLGQSYRNFELILVNDGSTDGSGDLCDSYAALDERIVLVHKKNGGVSSARNAGVEVAKGEYLFFVDGDDLMNSGALDAIRNTLSDKKFSPDVIFANFCTFFGDAQNAKEHLTPYDVDRIESLNQDALCYYLFAEVKDFRMSVWSHVYRTSFLKSNGLRFDTNLVIAEDNDWQMSVILSIEQATASDTCIYLYRKDNLKSAMNTPFTLRKYESNHYFRTKWFPFFFNEFDGPLSKPVMVKLFAKGYIDSSVDILRIESVEDKKKALELFENQFHIVKHSPLKYRLFSPIRRILGVGAFIRVIALAQKLNRAIKLSFK